MSSDTTTDGTDGESSSAGVGQQDLPRTLILLKQSLKENKQLTRNFSNLKDIHLRLAASHEQLQHHINQLQQERVAVEQQYQQLCESWRAELQEKQGQFEAARAQILQPRDLDLLRVQLLEEVEAPFQAKCQAIAQEAEAAQQQFVQLRRRHEALQNSIRTQEMQQQNSFEVLQRQHTALQQTLAEKQVALEAAQGRVPQLEQQLRRAQQQREEASMQLQLLQDEASDLRRSKEAAVVEKEQLAVKLERHQQQQQSEIQQLQALADGLLRRNRHLQEELAEAGRAQEATHSNLMQLQAQHAALSSQLADVQASAVRDRQLLAGKAEAAEQQWQERRQELMSQLLAKESQVGQLTQAEQQAVQRADAKAAEQQAAAAAAAGAAEQVVQLTSALEASTAAAAELQAKLLDAEEKAHTEVAAAPCEADSARSQLGTALVDLADLQQQLAAVQSRHAAVSSSYRQLEEAAEPGLAARIHNEAKCVLLEQQAAQSEARLAEATRQMAELQAQQEQLQAEAAARLASLAQAAAAERERLTARHASKVKKLKEAAKEQIRLLRSQLKESRAAAERLNEKLSSLRLDLDEASEQLLEQGAHAGSPHSVGPRMHYYPGSPDSSSSTQHSPATRVTLATALAGIRQRQLSYLNTAGS